MKAIRTLRLAGPAVCSAMLLATAVPATAASSPRWKVVYSKHFGGPANQSAFDSVVAPASGQAWAFGATSLVDSGGGRVQIAAHWVHGAWRNVPMPTALTDSIFQVSAASADDIWAVTTLGGFIVHSNGTRWTIAKQVPGNGEFTGVSAISRHDTWVFGGGGFTGGLGTWHYNGSHWRRDNTATADGLEHASAVSRTDIWAIGGRLTPYTQLYHYDGAKWTLARGRALTGLSFPDIVATSATEVWALAQRTGSALNAAWLYHLRHGRWSKIRLPWQVSPNRLIPDGAGGFWITGVAVSSSASWLMHVTRSGGWSRIPMPTIYVARIPGTQSFWGVGHLPRPPGSSAVIWLHGKA